MGTLSHQPNHASTWWTNLSITASEATLPAPFDVIVDLLSALPLGSWMWVAVAIAVLFIAAHLTRQRTPIVTLADHLDEIDSEVRR